MNSHLNFLIRLKKNRINSDELISSLGRVILNLSSLRIFPSVDRLSSNTLAQLLVFVAML